MRKNNYIKQRKNNHRTSGQTYVWRIRWWNMNVRNGANQYKCFVSKVNALMFHAKLKSNPNNYVASIEKVSA